MRPFLAVCLVLAAVAASPAVAAAVPPVNDNYLASLPADTPNRQFSATADTTEATVQADLFNPNRDGQPLAGGGPEPTTCDGAPIGKTVWYDLAPQVQGSYAIRATGFATAVAVYEWSADNSRISRLVDCSTNGGADDLIVDVLAKHSYTIQVGGVGGAFGPLTLKADFFQDRDGDQVFEPLDKCASVPGVERFGGCPPELKTRPRISVDYLGNGVRVTRLTVSGVPKGAKVVARCGGCGSQTVKAKRTGTVSLGKIVGRTVANGKKVEVSVTMGRTGTGNYKYGATGTFARWEISGNRLGRIFERCLNVRTSKLETC
jgi:hypothetical protein